MKKFKFNLSKINLKSRIIIAIPVLSTLIWLSVILFYYNRVNSDVAKITANSTRNLMQQYTQLIVDGIRTGDILGVRNITYGLINDNMFSGVVILDDNQKVLLRYPLWEKGIVPNEQAIEKQEWPKGYIYHPIYDRFGTQWGHAYIKPSVNSEVDAVFKRINRIIYFGIGMLFIEIALVILLLNIMFKPLEEITSEIDHLAKSYKNDSVDLVNLRQKILSMDEGDAQRLGQHVLVLAEEIEKHLIEIGSLSASAAIGKIATQVAHDVRSPLAALEMIGNTAQQLPEGQRILLRGSVQRINDIVYDLSSKKKSEKNKNPEDENYKVYLLSALIESLVSEKRLQYRNTDQLNIEALLDHTSYGLFCKLKAHAFKRVLSNIINNSVE
ncbi:MAG: HAMP domain-containing histidine kinase, partial [Deltaproteobacteria bacterium]|nr:HAMP domain-containing histidine kinase [Deltaproteobacteria bacterium]